ncbi:MAG: enoyl-CoA hydratase [Hyphomicrobiaceae bacterium]|nr:enoyl-CoA hydratase [Hyphomicrobiaceae bacterium]
MQDHAQLHASNLLAETRDDTGIVTLTMNSARGPVTLSTEMLTELQAAFDRLSSDDDARVVILAATGPAFCAGHDLKEMTSHRGDQDGGRAFYAQLMQQCATMMQTIMRCPKPVIAAVHGHAAAAGCQLVATCDLAVAADVAMFGTTGITNGLFCSTPMVALSRKVHRKHALEMLYTGNLVSAERAAEMGLVNSVAPAGEVMAAARALAADIARHSPAAVAFGKTAFYQQIERPISEAYDLTADVMVENMMHCDAIEGIGAFIEKRKPVWRGDKV